MKGHIDLRMGGIYRDKGLEGILPEGIDTWEKFISNMGDDLRQWLENNFPYINNPFTWENFITNFGDEFNDYLTENYPFIDDSITWENFIDIWGDDMRQWLTQNYPYIDQSETFNDFINNFGDEFKTWLTQNFPTINEGDTWEDFITNMGDDMRQWLTENYPFIDNSESWEEYVTNIIKQYYDYYNGTRLISGSIVWLENLDFLASHLVYEILGTRYESPETSITIPANVSADPMFAVIYADVLGNVGYIQGVPAANPAIPHVDDNTQILLTPVYIPGLGTEPGVDPGGETGAIVTEQIYDENVEWTTAKVEDANLTIDFEKIADPSKNVKHIQIDFADPAGDAWIFKSMKSFPAIPPMISVPLNVSELTLNFAEIFPDNLTDVLTGDVRKLTNYIWYTLAKTATLKNSLTGDIVQVDITATTRKDFDVAELNFSVSGYDTVTITAAETIPLGVYLVQFDNLKKVVYTFKEETAGSVFIPLTTEISFTRGAGAINAAGGVISMDLKTSVPWFETTGLQIVLYNGTNLVGRAALLPNSYRGFDPNSTIYQTISIPFADFSPSGVGGGPLGDEITKLVIIPGFAWPNNSSFKIDNIVLQTGVETITPKNPVKIGDWIEDIAFEFRDVTEAAQEYVLDIAASFPYKIIEAILQTDAGTITAKIGIDGTDITGLAAAAVDNTIQTFQTTALNKVVTGQQVKLTISALNGAAAISGKLKIVRT